MVLNRVWLAAVGAAALAWGGLSAAQQYRADEFLNLDLSRAVLSPKPLGPAAGFIPGPLDVTVDRGKNAAQAGAELAAEPQAEPNSASTSKSEVKTVATATVRVEDKPAIRKSALKAATPGVRIAHARAERPTPHKPRALVALHGRNPAEAQARDTAIQTWPCKSGGICNWKH
jgi:hypothetical protein